MRRRTLLIGGTILAVLVIVPPLIAADEEPGRADHPCRRITSADLEAVVSAPVTITAERVFNQGLVCSWSYRLPSGRVSLSSTSTLGVGVWQGRRYYVPDAVGEAFTPVPGIADAAHVDLPNFITFRTGETVVVIVNEEGLFLPMDRRPADELPRLRALAALVASRY